MTDPIDLAALRSEYEAVGIHRNDLPADPLLLWQGWLHDAQVAKVAEINAMVVSTVDPDGRPSSRTVLCKGADERGFVFYTNYSSRKGTGLASEPRVSLLFPWHQLSRQVIVDGIASRVSPEESAAYFATRPRGAQVSAWASRQSRPVTTRAQLEERMAQVEEEYAGGEVPCPPWWGGFVVRPERVEFWQGRRDRAHDRLRYVRGGAGWFVERLAP